MASATQAQRENESRATKTKSWFDIGRSKYEDFDEVARSQDVAITPYMAEAMIVRGDVGAEMAYFLGNNPGVASKIAAMSPLEQLIELGKLEVKLTSPGPKPRTITKAPAPIAPVVAPGEAHLASLEEIPVSDFMKRRNAETRK